MLIRQAQLAGGALCDVRIAGDRIADIGSLHPHGGECVVDARGGALWPGLHDHHIHLAASAARLDSVVCGPPAVRDVDDLALALAGGGRGWLRAVGYHESVAGMLDRDRLDALCAQRPVRIQHRSGRMWFLNSCAIKDLLARAPAPGGLDIATGRLFDEDDWLRRVLSGSPPDLGALSRQLAACGVTGVTEISPSNDLATVHWLADQQRRGRLLQSCMVAGKPDLTAAVMPQGLIPGPLKLHLHEAAFPDIDQTTALIAQAHEAQRIVAIHCVSAIELIFAMAVLDQAGVRTGDRIEHAGVADDGLVARCAQMGLHVVSQPHFIFERGEQYLAAVPAQDHPHLYRLGAFARAGVVLAAGSDAPYGSIDPWLGMRAAVKRKTATGIAMGADEALSPEDALRLYLKAPQDLSVTRQIVPGAAADLVLLDRPWQAARHRLESGDVRMTIARGKVIHDSGKVPEPA